MDETFSERSPSAPEVKLLFTDLVGERLPDDKLSMSVNTSGLASSGLTKVWLPLGASSVKNDPKVEVLPSFGLLEVSLSASSDELLLSESGNSNAGLLPTKKLAVSSEAGEDMPESWEGLRGG